MIYKRVRVKLGGKGVFVRSSTNAEDLPGFNGAGLYDTVPNVVGKKQLGEALKTVWASLWNFRAVDERDAFGIDHRQVYSGVLVQVGVNATPPGCWSPRTCGCDRRSRLHDQREVRPRDARRRGPEGARADRVRSDQRRHQDHLARRRPGDAQVRRARRHQGAPGTRWLGRDLSEERAKRLCEQVEKVIAVLPRDAPLDIEWVLEGERFWIVQARPYVGG